MIEEIKILLGDGASSFTNAQIGLTYQMALSEVLEYTKAEQTHALELLAARISVIMLNKLGSEGLSSQSFNSISESFLNGLPDDIMKSLNMKRKIWVM